MSFNSSLYLLKFLTLFYNYFIIDSDSFQSLKKYIKNTSYFKKLEVSFLIKNLLFTFFFLIHNSYTY